MVAAAVAGGDGGSGGVVIDVNVFDVKGQYNYYIRVKE